MDRRARRGNNQHRHTGTGDRRGRGERAVFHARLGATAALAAGGTSLTEPRLMSTSTAARCANREERNRAPAGLGGLAVFPLFAKAGRVAVNAQNGTQKRAHPGGHSLSDNGTRVQLGALRRRPASVRGLREGLTRSYVVVFTVLQSRTCLLKRGNDACRALSDNGTPLGCCGGGFGCPAADVPPAPAPVCTPVCLLVAPTSHVQRGTN